MKNKFKTYSFWMSVCAAVVLVINNLAKAFGFSFDNEVFTQIIDSVCGVLVVFGVLTISKKDKEKNTTETKPEEAPDGNEVKNEKEAQKKKK